MSRRPQVGDRIIPYRVFHAAVTPNWLLKRPELGPGPKMLYARLVQYAGKNGRILPRQDTLAAELGTNTRQIGRWMQELVKEGLLRATRRGQGSSNSYDLLVHRWMTGREHWQEGPIEWIDGAWRNADEYDPDGA